MWPDGADMDPIVLRGLRGPGFERRRATGPAGSRRRRGDGAGRDVLTRLFEPDASDVRSALARRAPPRSLGSPG